MTEARALHAHGTNATLPHTFLMVRAPSETGQMLTGRKLAYMSGFRPVNLGALWNRDGGAELRVEREAAWGGVGQPRKDAGSETRGAHSGA